MADLIEMVVALAGFAFLMLMGLLVGGATERRHLRNLNQREQALAGMLVTQIRTFPHAAPSGTPPQMFVAEVVVGSDYLKTFLASVRKLFGGEIRSYVTLVDRARREATLRVLEEAYRQGYNAVCNLRLETAQIHNATTTKMPMATIMASGTAYHAVAVTANPGSGRSQMTAGSPGADHLR